MQKISPFHSLRDNKKIDYRIATYLHMYIIKFNMINLYLVCIMHWEYESLPHVHWSPSPPFTYIPIYDKKWPWWLYSVAEPVGWKTVLVQREWRAVWLVAPSKTCGAVVVVREFYMIIRTVGCWCCINTPWTSWWIYMYLGGANIKVLCGILKLMIYQFCARLSF